MSLLPSPLKSTALLTLACLSATAAVAQAQEAEPRNRVVIVENVKFDYAQVLNVEPVFQTLRATRTEEHCEPISTRTLAPVNVTGEEPVEDKGRISRFWDSVRSMFKRSDEEVSEETAAETPAPAPANNGPMLTRDCRIVPVGREFRRPIAYDVDYVYKGTKYRSRLPEDPGNRLKIRVSITPGSAPSRAPPVIPDSATPAPCVGPGRMQRLAAMKLTDFQHDSSAARQASGMTSRARRPEPHILAG